MATEAKGKKRKKSKVDRPAPSLPTGCESLLGKAQICFAVGVSLRTFQGMLAAGEFPPPDTRVGKFPRWRTETLNDWIRRRCKVAEATPEG